MTTDHPLEDHTGDALRIFRDCLRPRIEKWLLSASQEHLEALRDRELLQTDDLNGITRFHDPLFLLDLILNSDELNRNLFGRAVGSEQLKQIRRTRNRWAHFAESSFNSQRSDVNGIASLLANAGHREEAERVRSLIRRQRQQLDHAEVNQRINAVAEQEQQLRRREAAVETEQARVRSDHNELAEQRSLLEQEQEQTRQRRREIERRERELRSAPTADSLRQRQEAVEADETVVAQLRVQYQQVIERSKQRELQLQQREAALQARETAADQGTAAIESQRVMAAELSERLSDAIGRIEELEGRMRATEQGQPRQSSPGMSEAAPTADTARERDTPADRQASTSSVRTCLRPGCDGTLRVRNGRRGKFFGCTAYPQCRYTEDASSGDEPAAARYGECPDCSGMLLRRNSYRGPFLGCINYPQCRYTEDLGSTAGLTRDS